MPSSIITLPKNLAYEQPSVKESDGKQRFRRGDVVLRHAVAANDEGETVDVDTKT